MTDDDKNPNSPAVDRADPWRAAELMSPPRAATVSVVVFRCGLPFPSSFFGGPHGTHRRGFFVRSHCALTPPSSAYPAGRVLPPCPAAGGAFLCGPRRSAQPMMRLGVGVAGLPPPRQAHNDGSIKLSPALMRGFFSARRVGFPT